jgi:hypothetical protein
MKKNLALVLGIAMALTPLAAEAQTTVTSSVISVHGSKAGQFCKHSDLGKVKRASNGHRIKCKKVNGRARWVNN